MGRRPIKPQEIFMFVLPLSRSSVATRARVVPTFSTALDRLFDESSARALGAGKTGGESRTPAMDVSESDASYTVVFDLPGASREQLKVSVEGRKVTLTSAETSEVPAPAPGEGQAAVADANPSAERVLYRERSAAVYSRTVVLPAEVDQAASQAKFENGVLRLTLAKKVPSGATQISIA
jgi:HSP20 family protein